MSATVEMHRSGGGGALWLIAIAIVGVLLALASVGGAMEGATVSPHAEERHGAAALSGEAYLRSGGPFHSDDCRDGKKLWTWRADGVWWAAIVRITTEGSVDIKTIFDTDQAYIQTVRKRDGCGDGLHWGSHDMPSAQ